MRANVVYFSTCLRANLPKACQSLNLRWKRPKSVPIFQLGVSTLARWHVKHAGTQARWPVNHAGTQARWHVDYVSRQARMKCDLANSPRGFYLIRCLVLTGFSKIRCNETFPACSKSLFQAVGFLVKVRAQLQLHT